MNVAADKQWKVDKRIPVTLIFTLAVQFAGFVWYAATLSARVESNAEKITTMEKTMSIVRDKNSGIKDRVIRIEERQISNQRILERIMRSLDKRS